MLLCALLLGMVVGPLGAAPTNPRVSAPKPGPRFEKESGFFSRLFGSRTERNDDDEDDEDDDDKIRFRFRGPPPQYPPPPPGRIIITPRTRNGAPIRSEYPDPHLYPRVPEGTRSIAPSMWPPVYVPPPAPTVYFNDRYPRVQDQTRVAAPARIVVVPNDIVIVPTRPAASRQFPASPPPSTTLAPFDERNDPRLLQQPSQAAPFESLAALPPGVPATLPAPALPPGLDTPSSSFTVQPSLTVAPSPGPPSVEPTPPPPLPPFATPVPGRSGLVYPPGQDAIPENMVDVTYLARGTKVRDPVSKIVFRVP